MFRIQLPNRVKQYAKCRKRDAVLAVHPRMNQETHGDEYFYGLLLQHLPWRHESQLIQPYSTAEHALLAHRRLGNIATDEHFTRYDLEEAVRRVRALHNLGLHNADGHYDNDHISDLEWQDPMYDALDRSLNLEQSLGAYLDGADDATDAAAQTHGVVLPYGQLPNSPAFAAAVDDRLSDADYNSRLRNMTEDQRQVLTALGQHVEAGQTADPLRWFITGGAGLPWEVLCHQHGQRDSHAYVPSRYQ